VRYLADASALVRFQRKQAPLAWREHVGRGLVAVCEPTLAETLTMADYEGYETMEDQILQMYPWAVVPDGIWAIVSMIRRELARPSAHRALSVADLAYESGVVRAGAA
jgi:predicted nucleic acid-binding protein